VTKPDGKAVVNRCRTRAGAHRTLCRALGSAEENIHAVEPRKGCTVSGCWELKRKFRSTYQEKECSMPIFVCRCSLRSILLLILELTFAFSLNSLQAVAQNPPGIQMFSPNEYGVD